MSVKAVLCRFVFDGARSRNFLRQRAFTAMKAGASPVFILIVEGCGLSA
jgi:hypothetical protein